MLLSALVAATLLNAQASAAPAGHWEGKIQIPNQEMGLTLDLAKTPAGAWIGSVSVLKSTSVDVPIEAVSVEGTTVRFTSALPMKTTFEGTLSADGSAISGKVTSLEGSVPFQLARTGEANVKVPPPSSPLTKDFEGLWAGTIESDGKVRRVQLKLWPEDGLAHALLIAVDQGNAEIAVSTVTIKDAALHIESRAVSGTYDGTLGSSGEIAGTFTQGPEKIPLTFRRVPAAGIKNQMDDRFAADLRGVMFAHGAFDLTALFLICRNLETAAAHLVFK